MGHKGSLSRLEKSMQNAYEGHSKENEIAETSTEEDVEYKSKDFQRLAAARRAC